MNFLQLDQSDINKKPIKRSPSQVEKHLNSINKCICCLKQFEPDVRVPYKMNCEHFMCGECIKLLRTTEITYTCIMCERKTKISRWKEYKQDLQLFERIQKQEQRIKFTRQATINEIKKKIEKASTGNSTSLRIETDSQFEPALDASKINQSELRKQLIQSPCEETKSAFTKEINNNMGKLEQVKEERPSSETPKDLYKIRINSEQQGAQLVEQIKLSNNMNQGQNTPSDTTIPQKTQERNKIIIRKKKNPALKKDFQNKNLSVGPSSRIKFKSVKRQVSSIKQESLQLSTVMKSTTP